MRVRLSHSVGFTLALAVASMSSLTTAQEPVNPASVADGALIEKAREIHDRVLTLDAHIDMNPVNFTAERNYTQDLGIQAELPKMRAGGLDASFFVVYVRQRELTPEGYRRAYEAAIEKFDAVHRLTDEYAPAEIEMALTPDDVRRIHATGRKVALIGVENGYPIGEDISRIQEFYDRGARYMSLAHNGHNQLSDSNTGEVGGVWMHRGLSPLGTEAVSELNRLGIMIDVSHLSRESMMQTVALSQAPVIASHSAVRALVDHSRNLDDAQLLALRDKGGVVQIVAYPAFVKIRQPPSPERAEADADIRGEFGLPVLSEPNYARLFDEAWSQLPQEERAEYLAARREMNERFPPDPPANVSDFVDHIDYAVGLMGIDHVGIASDFNNGEGVVGWFDASETFNVTLELVRRDYTEEQIAKLWSENLLRVMAEVQQIGRELQAN